MASLEGGRRQTDILWAEKGELLPLTNMSNNCLCLVPLGCGHASGRGRISIRMGYVTQDF
jgi:hypothetical protein